MTNAFNIGLIGYGNVGSGVVKLLQARQSFFKSKFHTEFILKAICDRNIAKKNIKSPGSKLTTNYKDLLNNEELDVVIELIGGLHPAYEIVQGALKSGKHVITANKELISNHGKELFRQAHLYNRNIYFESAVMAGVPVIKTITEGIAGTHVNGLYGIINGTCNFILSEMTSHNCTFSQALKEAQKRGFAERNPTFDIQGIDSAHKLSILVYLALGKALQLKDIYTEGITHISHDDIEHAESLNLTIKLLAIAKKVGKEIEARVHPTLISKDHPVGSIDGVFNALFIDANPLGDILLSGEGAGKMSAASGIISDLINLASRKELSAESFIGNLYEENPNLKIKKIDDILTKFYIRFMATDKPGVLARITGILGKHGIGINSVTQKAHNRMSTVPVVMLTDYAPEKMVRLALDKIHKRMIVKSKPVAIRMEKLPEIKK